MEVTQLAFLAGLLILCISCLGCNQNVPNEMKGSEELMSQKAHGTCPQAPMKPLRWGADWDTADNICCFNRHYAERAGYWEGTQFPAAMRSADSEITFYDPVTSKPLFIAPRGRSWQDFEKESLSHGWPSFRDDEVVQANVRVLPNGEAVSVDGTHLGHNLPDGSGNRYCINLVSIAGLSPDTE
mmetsp:Transcript_74668/g.132084  ORF Transcript_74668/g.132084 Transcript_74668/m.132084 type:complete len:184 (+) Transcript_74668:36-587(+)|eukprot:CAMPEP_0197634368 /NCGR_PEP_ID=MMETSP1338-20131121/10487_1 /TAXON_ID=43686 ORGANISM="Pelagodinium beii, Strain RCC1491" /NCGR_SAMPLE_ID=MMETSP1338 /ASSEMBLY_ACC=CAM_ASM_000754 /LENGTH=183 /DNA_ID=CAMNT_0043206221 /DNA_START=15 /DNA_END=566 /DNA_ORIENTATION=-